MKFCKAIETVDSDGVVCINPEEPGSWTCERFFGGYISDLTEEQAREYQLLPTAEEFEKWRSENG